MIATVLVTVTLAAGCGSDEGAPASGEDGPWASAEGSQSGVQLAAQTLQQLAMNYPVLGREPVPPPTPSEGATPSRIPGPVATTAPERVLETATGEATFYADRFEGRRTASGIPFRQNQMVAAHRGYPFGTLLRVTNLRNDRSVNVRVVDRGPTGAVAKARKTIIDLSRRAAEQLGYVGAGRTPVRVEVLEWGRGVATR